MHTTRATTVTVRIDTEQHEQIRELAQEYRQDLSVILEQIIGIGIEKYEDYIFE